MVLAALIVVGITSSAVAQPAGTARPPVLLDNMDDETPALRLLESAPGTRIVEHSIEFGHSRFGAASERIVMNTPPGESGHLGYDLPPAPTRIEELQLAAWVFCNRPGVQLAATVVLPRSLDPHTGRPRELLVRSGMLAGAGRWQQITLEDLHLAVPRQARVARMQFGSEVSEWGAYVSRLVFLTPGGPGATELWVDQIAMHGVLRAPEAVAAAAPVSTAATDVPPAGDAPPAADVARNVAALPAVPRIIQWQGEPFEFLQRLGFDGVWMGRTPTADELAESRQLGLPLVCPPPSIAEIESHGIGGEYDPVAAWDLGQLAGAADVELAQEWARTIERRDPAASRRTMLSALGTTRESSRLADVVALGRPMVGASLSWPDYAVWLHQQRRLARPGTPLWIAIDTAASSELRTQQAAISRARPRLLPASLAELSQSTATAIATLPQGFYFQSPANLAADDDESRMRSLALELTNLRLGLVQPWLAAGKSSAAVRSNRDDLTALALKIERSHLIVPLHWNGTRGLDSTTADGSGPAPDGVPITTLVIPGAPESADAYVLSMAGPQRLRTRRVTGGLEVSIDRLPEDAFVLLTDDGVAFAQIERYLRDSAPRAAQARVELASLRRQQATRAIAELPPQLVATTGARDALAAVDLHLAAVIETMNRRDYAAAFAQAAESERLLDRLGARLWQAMAPDMPPGSSPLPAQWAALPEGVRVAASLASATGPREPLPGGEFESLDEFIGSGWQRLERPVAGVTTTVRLSTEAPASGSSSVELEVRQSTPGGAPPAIAAPPVWITSPPIAPPEGHLIEITGLVRMPLRPIGSADPLLVFDSIGGESSALRIESAPSWTPFRLVRAAAPGAECRITFALGGAGRAQIDALHCRFIPLAPPIRQPIAAQPTINLLR